MKKHHILLGGIIALSLLGAAEYAAWWHLHGRYHETTDDAYVGGNLAQITPQVAGTVLAIYADDTEFVKAGQKLIELDKADAQVMVAQAEAQLAKTVRSVRNLRAAETEEEADVSGPHAELRKAQEQLAPQRAMVDRADVHDHPDVRAAAARVREAYVALSRTELPAPIAGFVARRSVQVGQRVAPGAVLMTVASLEDVWVDANFKESQLANLRLGQPVTLVAEAYGSSVEFHGRVAGFGAGTDAAFALLPAQNASGDWIKVVQRVPVRIALERRELDVHPLQIGLSMKVDVDTHERGAARLQRVARERPPYETRAFGPADAPAEERIELIIAENGMLRPALARDGSDAR